MNSAPRIPSVGELLWPALRAVREIGDSGTIEEIVEKAIELEGFTEEQQAVLHGDGPRTKIEYRLAWARSYLKGMGALDNSERGVWSTTEAGRSMTPEDVVSRHAAYVASLREARKAKQLARPSRTTNSKRSQLAAIGRSACWRCSSRCRPTVLNAWLADSSVRPASSQRRSQERAAMAELTGSGSTACRL